MKGADISECGTYRYRLWRRWAVGDGTVNFIMLNPSTADADLDDPTIRRCIGFAKSWGYRSIMVTNLFALRATNPKELRNAKDPVSLRNDSIVCEEARDAGLVIAAWGNHGWYLGRSGIVHDLLCRYDVKVHHMGLTRPGYPKHPLYLPKTTEPTLWEQKHD